ncbi:MAG: hypothetical protein JW881_02325 [Spirochaetales bacterium]|nr:hypothetical protein [Spirochaetales bacterium]
MPIYLKLMKGKGSKGEILELGFCMDNDEDISIDIETALKEGFTTTQETFDRLKRLSELGQMYEEVDKSHKLEFRDLEEKK